MVPGLTVESGRQAWGLTIRGRSRIAEAARESERDARRRTIGVLRSLVGRLSAKSMNTRTWSPEPVRLAGDRELSGTDAEALARF